MEACTLKRDFVHFTPFTRSSRGSRRHVARLVSAALLALLMAMVASVQPASATVPGLQFFSQTSFTDSKAIKTQFVRCPAGKKVVGIGGRVTAPTGTVVLDDITPLADLTGAFVTAGEVASNQTSESWNVTAYAICADAAAVPGLELITKESGPFTGSSSPQTATASCPSGKQVLSAAASVNFSRNEVAGRVVLEDITPNASLTSVTAQAAETVSGTFENWTVKAYAICAFPPQGLQRIAATSSFDSLGFKFKVATCPSGTKLLGTGGDINTSASGRVGLEDVRPFADLSGLTVDAAEMDGNTSSSWSMRTYAICATP
jgi:hypothetical protein